MSARKATSSICTYTEKQIFVRGRDLCADVIGKMSLGDFIYLLIMDTPPNAGERAIVEAALVTLAEHGFTPSVIAARLTYMGAPESLQGAVAAGLLGVGDQFVGTVEQVAPLLVEMSEAADLRQAASAIVSRYREKKSLVPGFGQPHHKPDDPRSPALFAVGEKAGVDGKFVRALRVLGEEVDKSLGRHFTINAPAAIAALFLEIGIPAARMRGFVLISRCIGIVAHLAEEQTNPTGRVLWDEAAHAVEFVESPAS